MKHYHIDSLIGSIRHPSTVDLLRAWLRKADTEAKRAEYLRKVLNVSVASSMSDLFPALSVERSVMDTNAVAVVNVDDWVIVLHLDRIGAETNTKSYSFLGEFHNLEIDTEYVTYHSSRGIPLVFNRSMKSLTEPTNIVTVENYCKWYHPYVVTPEGKVFPLTEFYYQKELSLSSVYPEYIDHCPNPKFLMEIAEINGWEICEQSLEMIIGRWVYEAEQEFKL